MSRRIPKEEDASMAKFFKILLVMFITLMGVAAFMAIKLQLVR